MPTAIDAGALHQISRNNLSPVTPLAFWVATRELRAPRLALNPARARHCGSHRSNSPPTCATVDTGALHQISRDNFSPVTALALGVATRELRAPRLAQLALRAGHCGGHRSNRPPTCATVDTGALFEIIRSDCAPIAALAL